MGKDSGGSAPAVPDYTALANQQSKNNLALLRAQTEANRVNQVTPYGNLTYSHNPNRTFDQSGYDKAMQDYERQMDAYTSGNAGPQTIEYVGDGLASYPRIVGGGMESPVMPTRDSFYSGAQDGGWTATTTLSPDQQAILDAQEKLSQTNLGTAQRFAEGFDPTLNMSALPSTRINPGETYTDAALRFLQPQWDQQSDAERTRLANRGITLGSDAYSSANRDLNDRLDRARIQTTMLGLDKDQSARANAFNEQLARGNYGTNVINALKSGSQVTNPGFVNVPSQGYTPGPDLLGAAQQTYNGQLQNYNANVASDNSMMGGLFGLAGSALSGGGLGALGGLFGASSVAAPALMPFGWS